MVSLRGDGDGGGGGDGSIDSAGHGGCVKRGMSRMLVVVVGNSRGGVSVIVPQLP